MAARRAARILPWAVGLLAGVLALGPALGRGYVLRYDMVFVPDLSLPTVLRGADGFPRAIPSDAVVAALSAVLPGDLVQASALMAVFTVGGAGAARLFLSALGTSPASGGAAALAASAAAGVAYVWNPFVAERLLLGQWAVLLGYAGLPWVVAAVARLSATRRATGLAGIVCALVPAAVGGFSSVVLTALTAGPVALLRAGRWTATVLLLAALLLVSLPWLLPSLAGGAGTDPAGVEAFAARSDTPFGTVGSLLLLGGVWNSGAVPVGYGEPVTASARVLLCLAALAGWMWWLRGERPGFGPGLSTAAVLGFGIALLGTTGPGRELLGALIGLWPGFGPLRDGQLYVAPLALVQALGLAAAVRWIADTATSSDTTAPSGTTAPRLGAAVFVVLLPVAVLPGLLWGAGGRLSPVDYPEAWTRARDAVAADDRPGAVLVLPWSAYRGLEWSGETVVALDPAGRLFDRRTVWNDDLRVGTPDGETVVVTGEDTRAREAARVLEPDPATGLPALAEEGRTEELAARLGGLGVRYVAVSAQVDNQFWSQGPGLPVVVDGADMTLLRVPDQHIKPDKADTSGLEVTGGLVTVGAIIWSVGRSGSSLGFQRSGSRTGPSARKEIPK